MRRMEYSGFIQHFSNDDVNYERPHYPLSPQLGYNTVSSQNTAPFAFNYDYRYFGKTSERTRRSVNDRLKKFLDDAEAERVSGREKVGSSGVKRRRVEGDRSMPERLIRRDDDVSYLTRCLDLSLDRASEILASAEIAVPRREVIGNCRPIKHYSSGHRILVVGDGDFSFSTCLARAFGCASNMTATSLDSQRFLLLNYASALPNLMELKARNCKVIHDIDATEMASHSIIGKMKFDRIVFNFPFAGFFDDDLPRDSQLMRHKGLVSMFMQNAVEMMSENGEIHIRNKTTDYFEEWNLKVFGLLHRLRLVETVDFDLLDYPGYDTKYGFGGDGNFNCYPSKTYKFAR
ncbi:hypothetical protein ACP275_13G112500 [Erythranthe tilingii]